jgi:hypothetical protein
MIRVLKNNQYFVSGDPFTWLLKKRLRLRAMAIAFGGTILLQAPIAVVGLIDDLWVSTPNRVGLLGDYSWWIALVTFVPAIIYSFFWLPDGIGSVIVGLASNRAIGLHKEGKDDKTASDDFINGFNSDYSNWIWALLSLVIMACFVFFLMLPEQRGFATWQTSGEFVFWYTIAFWGLLFFLGLLAVIRVVIVIIWFNRLFRQLNIDVRVLHPDGAGGLSPLGEFSVRIGYLIGLFGVSAVSVSLTQSYRLTLQFSGPMLSSALVILIVVYALLAPIVFFAPIGAARFAMKAAKYGFILQIADQFEIETTKIQSLLGSDSDEIRKRLEKIEQLQKIHDIANRFPVWPFNVQSIIRFFSAVSSPFVLAIISIVIDLVK